MILCLSFQSGFLFIMSSSSSVETLRKKAFCDTVNFSNPFFYNKAGQTCIFSCTCQCRRQCLAATWQQRGPRPHSSCARHSHRSICSERHLSNLAIHFLSLVREVDVVEQEWEVLEHPLGEVEVDRGALEEADVEDSLPNTSSVFNLRIQMQLNCDNLRRELEQPPFELKRNSVY